jgi:hypothetical protein
MDCHKHCLVNMFVAQEAFAALHFMNNPGYVVFSYSF